MPVKKKTTKESLKRKDFSKQKKGIRKGFCYCFFLKKESFLYPFFFFPTTPRIPFATKKRKKAEKKIVKKKVFFVYKLFFYCLSFSKKCRESLFSFLFFF